jgi:anti-sigma-K factor RskA
MTLDPVPMRCEEADELAALYVLGALEAAEEERVQLHLATCDERHGLFAELGGVVPALLETVEPAEPPAELRNRVMAAIAATPQVAGAPAVRPEDRAVLAIAAPDLREPTPRGPSRIPVEPISLAAERQRRASGSRWQPIFAAAAVLLIVALGATTFMFQRQAADAEARTTTLRSAIAASLDPRSAVAGLHGSGVAATAAGFAAFPAEGAGYIVIHGLPRVDADRAYQAWFLADGKPYSAGLMSVGSDGLAIAQGVPMMSGASAVALTIEPAAGSVAPTSDPVMVGEMQPGPVAVSEG